MAGPAGGVPPGLPPEASQQEEALRGDLSEGWDRSLDEFLRDGDKPSLPARFRGG